MKIAFVKQDVYQDLYVCPAGTKDAGELLFSSMMRVGPIGLFSKLNTSFFIVEEDLAPECQIYRSVVPRVADHVQLLKTKTVDEMPGEEFKVPGSPYPNGAFSVPCRSINWSEFDIVISVNISIPTEVVRQYPSVLFCYMIGEANLASKWAEFGYDICLNQLISEKLTSRIGGAINFPYTFLGPDCLANIVGRETARPSSQDGVYAEINMSPERPVQIPPPILHPLVNAGYRVRIHKQNIFENLLELYDAKYFVKLGGRKIRGNSTIEAISCGTLALLPRETLIHTELLPKECSVESIEDLIRKIKYLDDNPDEYERLLALQRETVQTLCFENAVKSLELCLEDKRRITSRWSLIARAARVQRHLSAKIRPAVANRMAKLQKLSSKERSSH